MGALGHRDHPHPTPTPAHTRSLPPPVLLHRGLRIERPRLTVTHAVLHPSPPLPPGPPESDAARSPELGSVALYGTRTPVQGSGVTRRRFGTGGGAGSGGKGRARGLRRRTGLAPIGCGAGPASRQLAAALRGVGGNALDRLPCGTAVPTCRGLPRPERAWPAGGWLPFVCLGKESSRVKGSGTRTLRHGYPLHPVTLARHPRPPPLPYYHPSHP